MTTIYNGELEAIKELLLGHKVISVDLVSGKAILDDGTVLHLKGNDGCGGCSSGWYELIELNQVDNIITNVEFDDSPTNDYNETEGYYKKGYYKIFVFADNQRINFATFEGSDGNGYYGTGYSITVTLGDAQRTPCQAQ